MLIILGIILIGATLAPLSCIVLWNRFNNFSDSIIHSCIFGGLINQVTGLDIGISILISSSIIWLISIGFEFDNNIVFLSSMFLSAIATLFGRYEHLLFGDIIFINYLDLIAIILLSIIVYLYTIRYYKELVLVSISKDLALARNVKVNFHRNLCLFLIISSIAVSVKIIGGSFFIIGSILLPGMISRNFSRTPYNMLINSVIVSFIINLISISLSKNADLNFASVSIIVGFIIYTLSNQIKDIK